MCMGGGVSGNCLYILGSVHYIGLQYLLYMAMGTCMYMYIYIYIQQIRTNIHLTWLVYVHVCVCVQMQSLSCCATCETYPCCVIVLFILHTNVQRNYGCTHTSLMYSTHTHTIVKTSLRYLKGGWADAIGCESDTKYKGESAKLGGGNLSLGWEIPGHPTLCVKHCSTQMCTILWELLSVKHHCPVSEEFQSYQIS